MGESARTLADVVSDGSARMKPRRCTDFLWAVIFIVSFGAYCYVMYYAYQNGKPAQFQQLYQTGITAAQQSQAQTQQYKDKLTKIVATVMEVLNEKALLSASAILAAVLGIAFLFLLKTFASPIIHLCLFVLVLSPFAAGSYLLYVSGDVFGAPAPDPNLPSLAGSQTNLYAGLGAILLGLILAVVACCSTKQITLAVDCVEVAVNCTFAMPSMLLAPALHFVSLCILVPIMCSGFVYLLSAGNFKQPDTVTLASAVATGNKQQAFNGAGVEYTNEQYIYIAIAFFMIFWVIEFCAALSQFSMAYSVILWYFTPYQNNQKQGVPFLAVLKGYMAAGRYHFGSLACGSFFVALLGAFRVIMSLLEQQAKNQGNCVGRIIAAIIGCCVDCFKRALELLNKLAYVDIAMNSSSYCNAVVDAVKVIATYGGAIAVLAGTMWILKFAGAGAIAAATGWIIFMYTESSNNANSTSIAIGAAIIAAMIAVVLMNVLDMVVDAILFCFASDKEEIMEEAHKSTTGRCFACCGLESVAERANTLYHSEAAASAMGKVGLKGKAAPQYVPLELRPLMSKHG